MFIRCREVRTRVTGVHGILVLGAGSVLVCSVEKLDSTLTTVSFG